jgi:hypothetical protein
MLFILGIQIVVSIDKFSLGCEYWDSLYSEEIVNIILSTK